MKWRQVALNRLWPAALWSLLFVASSQAASMSGACSYLNEDFSGLSSNTWSAGAQGEWTYQNETLSVSSIPAGKIAFAQTDFLPSDLFSIDVDAEVVNYSSNSDAFGLYPFTSGDVMFSVNDRPVDGVAVLVFPKRGAVEFMVWNFETNEWNFSDPYPIAGPLTSVGLTYAADGVIFRANKQDTNLKLRGDFSSAGWVIDKLWLMATGADMRVRFDNVCAAPAGGGAPVQADAMPVPSGREIFPYSPVSSPTLSLDAASAKPVGIGPAAQNGDTLGLQLALPALSAPADVYVAFHASFLPDELFFFTQGGDIVTFSSVGRLVKWKGGTTGDISEQLLGGISVGLLPPGTYTFYCLLSPEGRLDAYYLWYISVRITGGSGAEGGAGGTASDMEREIRGTIDVLLGGGGLDILLGLSSSESGMLGEITSVLSQNSGFVTMTPSTIDFFNLPRTIKLDLDFGSGYRAQDGSVLKGSGTVNITNIEFGATAMSADFTLTADNINRDGVTLLNGSLSGHLSLAEQGEKPEITGRIQFNNFSLQGITVSGSLGVSIADVSPNLSDPAASGFGTITLTPTNLSVGEYSISSGTIVISAAGTGRTRIDTNLSTNKGPMDIMLLVSRQTGGTVIVSSEAPGTVGPYTMTVLNLTADPAVCMDYPVAGSLKFSRSGTNAEVRFTPACDGSYQYTETP